MKDVKYDIKMICSRDTKDAHAELNGGKSSFNRDDVDRSEVLTYVRKLRSDRSAACVFQYRCEDKVSMLITLNGKSAWHRLQIDENDMFKFNRNEDKDLRFIFNARLVYAKIRSTAGYTLPERVQDVRKAIATDNIDELKRMIETEGINLVYRASAEEIEDIYLLKMALSEIDDDTEINDEDIEKAIAKTEWCALDDAVMHRQLNAFTYVLSHEAWSQEELDLALNKICELPSGPLNELVRQLIEKGADPNAAFDSACRSGSLELIKQLFWNELTVLDESKESAIRNSVVHTPGAKDFFEQVGVDPTWLDPYHGW